MPGPKITHGGNIPIVKVGHTVGKNHGTNPLARMRGENEKPTPITFGGK